MIHISQWVPTAEVGDFRDAARMALSKDRLDNPFERKWILHGYWGRHMLELQEAVAKIARPLCTYELYHDEYFKAVMRYNIGDFLKLHYDATVHPLHPEFYKAVTGILYLSSFDCEGGELEFYSGGKRLCSLQPTFGNLVVFSNDLFHGNPQPVIHGTRIAATVSMMSKVPVAPNLADRIKAYFMPGPDERWSEEMCRLRDLRADPEHYGEVHRVGV